MPVVHGVGIKEKNIQSVNQSVIKSIHHGACYLTNPVAIPWGSPRVWQHVGPFLIPVITQQDSLIFSSPELSGHHHGLLNSGLPLLKTTYWAG